MYLKALPYHQQGLSCPVGTFMARLSDTNNIERSKCTTDGCQALIECNLIPFQPPRLSFLFAQVAQWTGLVSLILLGRLALIRTRCDGKPQNKSSDRESPSCVWHGLLLTWVSFDDEVHETCKIST